MDIHSWKLFQEQQERLIGRLAPQDTWEHVEAVIAWAMTSAPKIPTRHLNPNHVIIWGETDAFHGFEKTADLLTQNPLSTLIVTGGVYGRETTIKEFGAIDLFQYFFQEMRKRDWEEKDLKARVILDSWSLHTGHQRSVLSALLKTLDAQSVSVVLPLYHMPRFLLTLGQGLLDEGIGPKILPCSFGELNTHHIAKGPLNEEGTRMFSYEELFALPPTPSRGADDTKSMDCGEIDKILHYQQASDKQCLTFREAHELFKI